MSTQDFIDGLATDLASFQFKSVEQDATEAAVFQRQGFSLTKFGMLDTFVIAKAFDTLDATAYETFSATAMATARLYKHWLPCGLGSVLVTYPVAVVEKADPDLVSFAESHCPKHYSAFEYPVIIERSTKLVHHYTGTPLWGMAYYNGFKTEVAQLFG